MEPAYIDRLQLTDILEHENEIHYELKKPFILVLLLSCIVSMSVAKLSYKNFSLIYPNNITYNSKSPFRAVKQE